METIREWHNDEWELDANIARSQKEMQYMARKIIATADTVENDPTPGHSRQELSRVLVCKSSLLPGTRYIIHIDGFTVEDIMEIIES